MTGNNDQTGLIAEIDRYLDTVPRAASRVETIGPFTLFVSRGPSTFYARPSPGRAVKVTAGDVEAVLARQRQLAVPQALEWVRDVAPEVEMAARAAGLSVRMIPLLALAGAASEVQSSGVRVRVLDADDDALPATLAAIEIGFRTSGGAIGSEGVAARDDLLPSLAERIAYKRDMIRREHQICVAVEADDGPVAGGTASPRGDVAELTGIATLPAWRRRGIGALVTASLVAAVRSTGVPLAFLGADDDDVARVYERVGFTRIGSVGEAEPNPEP